LEYMAAGRAIVATAVGAAPRLIVHGHHGLLVPPGDPAALAQAIRDTLLDPEAAALRAAAARRRARQKYSRQAMIERFQRFFEDLVFGRKGLPCIGS
jgi:glycosyltransferase involved in cell wall biosynthesis